MTVRLVGSGMTILEKALWRLVSVILASDVDVSIMDNIDALSEIGWLMLECGCMVLESHAVDCDMGEDCSCAFASVESEHGCEPVER